MCLGEMATVVAIDPAAITATVDVGGRQRTVSLALLPDLAVGTRVVVHTGFVIEVVDATVTGADAQQDHEDHGRWNA